MKNFYTIGPASAYAYHNIFDSAMYVDFVLTNGSDLNYLFILKIIGGIVPSILTNKIIQMFRTLSAF